MVHDNLLPLLVVVVVGIVIIITLYLSIVLSLITYARVAEWSKAIVSGTILFGGAGSNPASCILRGNMMVIIVLKDVFIISRTF